MEHIISRAALKARKGSSPSEIVSLTAAHIEIPDDIMAQPEFEKPAQPPLEVVNLRSATEDYQRDLIKHTLTNCDGNWSRAAKLLSMDRGNLVRLAKRLGVYIKKEVVGGK
ncbi:helix-turn-helix domain-containing protein [Microbulbifer sp. VTAC004]|uniref:helix-turn-helix domain-containing protein n=1 Tax=Microbulbifer sp. VTAC004 TaxID=3243386 RepID=UPI00403A263F